MDKTCLCCKASLFCTTGMLRGIVDLCGDCNQYYVTPVVEEDDTLVYFGSGTVYVRASCRLIKEAIAAPTHPMFTRCSVCLKKREMAHKLRGALK